MKIKEVLQKSAFKLKKTGIEEPFNKARILLAFILKQEKTYLLINQEKEITKEQIEEFNKVIERLIEGEPIQYIIEKQEFMGIDFFVNKNVLIPQPDTEILVEKVIEICKNLEKPKILDLCTGSGAIAISLCRHLKHTQIIGTDISEEALEIAKKNDKAKEIKFIKSNLFENIEERFDIIVSNPPYIKTKEIQNLSKEVQKEPHLALDGGQDGLKFYKEIIGKANKYLNTNGYLCLEIGNEQKEEIIELIELTKKYKDIKSYKDLGNNDRVIICKGK